MKVSDAFNGEIVTNDHGGNLLSISDDKGTFCLVNVHCAEHVAMAIKNHDKLVEMLKYFYKLPVDFNQVWAAGHLSCQHDARELLKELGHEI